MQKLCRPEQLLAKKKKKNNTGRRYQTPRKAAHSLQKEDKIRKTKRDKRVRDRDPSWGGSPEGEVSKQKETLSPVGLWGVLVSQRAT